MQWRMCEPGVWLPCLNWCSLGITSSQDGGTENERPVQAGGTSGSSNLRSVGSSGDILPRSAFGKPGTPPEPVAEVRAAPDGS